MSSTLLPEAQAFVAAARSLPSNAVTMATGWTAHDLVTHMVAGGAEMARLIGLHLQGEPVPETMSLAEREPAFRALPFEQLVELLGGTTLGDAIALVAEKDSAATIPFTGWEMTASDFATHVRSELALHRWDLVGSDETGTELLSVPELTAHAVRSLNNFGAIGERLSERTRRSRATGLDVRLRVEGQPDVRLVVGDGQTTLGLVDNDESPAIVTTTADRLLTLWGRRPCPPSHTTSEIDSTQLRAAFAWLYS